MVHETMRFVAVLIVLPCATQCATITVVSPLDGRIGDRSSRTTSLHVEEPGPSAPPAPVPAATAQATAVEARPDVDLGRIRASLRPRHLLRIRGDFGWAIGRIDSISSSGLHGLRPDPRYDAGPDPVPDPVPWSSITRVDRRGNSAAMGAVIGGVALTLLSGISTGAFTSGSHGLEAGLIVLSLPAGAVVGSLIGVLIPAWHPVPGTTDPPPLRAPTLR